MQEKEIKIHINDKEVSLREIIEDFHKIHLISTDNCAYCKREGIESDKDKINLIRKITSKYFKEVLE